MSVLIVVAHPDDEVLGCGGTAALLAAHGVTVQSCILSAKAEVRSNRPCDRELMDDILHAQEALGLGEPILGHFPNIKFNVVPHFEIVRFIEDAIIQTRAQVVFTHHPSDLNEDHRITSQACQAACRLFQRRPGIPRLKTLLFMEILSSTEWAFSGSHLAFQPTVFWEIGEEFLDKKIRALQAYRGVMRKFPHPRSEEVLRGLAAFRGAQAGAYYAEAFQLAFQMVECGKGVFPGCV